MIAEKNSLREEWGLSQSFVVGYSGNLGRGHDFNVLLDAAWMLADEPAIRFLFIGSGAGTAAVVRRVRELGLTNVTFKPFQPRSQLGATLTVPDIHIVSLKTELSGLIVPSKFYGALAAGRVVIFLGPESSEIARVIRDCDCGFVYENSRAVDIERTIQELRSNCDLREKLGRNARLAVDNHYNKAASLEAWQATLDPTER
jgi:glycosyltransferase involved in cell wall biosynthesis